jgi:hypothetical protein
MGKLNPVRGGDKVISFFRGGSLMQRHHIAQYVEISLPSGTENIIVGMYILGRTPTSSKRTKLT